MTQVLFRLSIEGQSREYTSPCTLVHRAANNPSDTMAAVPDVMGNMYDPDGGVPQLASCVVLVTDPALLTTNSTQLATLASDCTASATSLALDSTLNVAPGDTVFVGAEAVAISAESSPNITVTRGQLSTTAQIHVAGTPIWDVSPVTLGRRCTLTMERDGSSVVIHKGYITGTETSRQGHALQITGELEPLSQTIPSAPTVISVDSVSQDARIRGSRLSGYWSGLTPSGTDGYMHSAKGVLLFDGHATQSFYEYGSRSHYGDLPMSGDVVTLIYGCDHLGSNFPPDWPLNKHPLSIVLTLLTSSARPDDGLYEANGTYATMAPGYGIGIPQAKIAMSVFEDEIERTPHMQVSNFYFGHEPKRAGEVLDSLLKLGRWYLTMDEDLITVKRHGVYRTLDNLTTLTSSDVSDWNLSVNSQGVSTDYALETSDSTFQILLSPSNGLNTFARSKTSVDASLLRGSLSGWLQQLLLHRVNERAYGPRVLSVSGAKLDHMDLIPGQLLTVDLNGLEDPLTGTTSLSGQWRLLNVDPSLAEQSSSVALTLEQAYNLKAVQTMGVSAKILTANVSNEVTVENSWHVYFNEGDTVSYLDRDLVDSTPGTATITDITAGVITLSGNFGGTLIAAADSGAMLYVTGQAYEFSDDYVLGDHE